MFVVYSSNAMHNEHKKQMQSWELLQNKLLN